MNLGKKSYLSCQSALGLLQLADLLEHDLDLFLVSEIKLYFQ